MCILFNDNTYRVINGRGKREAVPIPVPPIIPVQYRFWWLHPSPENSIIILSPLPVVHACPRPHVLVSARSAAARGCTSMAHHIGHHLLFEVCWREFVVCGHVHWPHLLTVPVLVFAGRCVGPHIRVYHASSSVCGVLRSRPCLSLSSRPHAAIC